MSLFKSFTASCGGGLRPQWRRPGWWLWQGWVMSPSEAGSDPDRFDLVWFLCDPPPLSCGRMGGQAAQLLKYSRKDTWETPAVSHIIFVSHTGTGGEGGRGCDSCPWSELCLTYLLNVTSCTFILLPPAEERREEVLNVSFQLFIQVFFKQSSLFPLQPRSSTYFKMWTCQSNTSMSNLMWLNFFFLSLFKPLLYRTRGYCGTSCVDFSYTTLFQLCENKMTFLLKK